MAHHSCFSLSLNDWRLFYHMFLKHDLWEDHFHGILIGVLLGRTPTLVKWLYLTQLWVNFSEITEFLWELTFPMCLLSSCIYGKETCYAVFCGISFLFSFLKQSSWNFCSTEFTLYMMIKVLYFCKSLQIYFFRKVITVKARHSNDWLLISMANVLRSWFLDDELFIFSDNLSSLQICHS